MSDEGETYRRSQLQPAVTNVPPPTKALKPLPTTRRRTQRNPKSPEHRVHESRRWRAPSILVRIPNPLENLDFRQERLRSAHATFLKFLQRPAVPRLRTTAHREFNFRLDACPHVRTRRLPQRAFDVNPQSRLATPFVMEDHFGGCNLHIGQCSGISPMARSIATVSEQFEITTDSRQFGMDVGCGHDDETKRKCGTVLSRQTRAARVEDRADEDSEQRTRVVPENAAGRIKNSCRLQHWTSMQQSHRQMPVSCMV